MKTQKVYNDKGELLCNEGKGHEFVHGLCKFCFCPETPKDQARAEAHLYSQMIPEEVEEV